ncbi:hypothetical protein Tco_0812775, partial [Tanacetum coccineum]
IMEMEPDIESMTLNEYLKYEAEKERRSKRSPTKYEEAYFDSFHQDKSSTFNYPYYHGVTPIHPCFQPAQPYTGDCLVSSNTSDEVDIDSMKIAEYELYIAKHDPMNNPLNDHSYSFTSSFWLKQKEAKVEDCNEGDIDIWDVTVGDVEWLRQLLTPSVHALPEPKPIVQPCVPLLPSPDEVMVVRDKEPNNDVNRISIQVPDVIDDEIQPSIPQPIHTTPLIKIM